jgi:hypothetical protein
VLLQLKRVLLHFEYFTLRVLNDTLPEGSIHEGSRGSKPKRKVFARNKERAAKARAALAALAWSSLTLWECEIKDIAAVRKIIRGFLGSASAPT